MKSSSRSGVIRGADRALTPYVMGESHTAGGAFAPFTGGGARPLGVVRPTLEARMESARRLGLEEGLAEGRAQCEAELEGLRTTLDLVVRELWSHREQLYREVEPDVTRLALEVARRVVGQVAQREAGLVEHMAAEALRRVSARDRITLRVHPEDLETVRAQRERWLHIVEGVEHLEIIEDRRVPRGGALVTTVSGSVDARWSTQLTEIERALMGQEGPRDADA